MINDPPINNIDDILIEEENPEKHLELALKHLHIFYKLTKVNALDNYGYREYGANKQLKSFLPSIFKLPGRYGDDASAINEGYYRIEQKSGLIKNKTLSISSFPSGEFDKQGDPVRREYIFKYDGLLLSCFQPFNPYPFSMVFVPKEHIEKLHPLMRDKQEERVRIFEKKKLMNKNIGRDSIKINLKEILNYIDKTNLICYLKGEIIDSVEFFQKLENQLNLDE